MIKFNEIYKVSVQRVDGCEIFSTTCQGIRNVVRYMKDHESAVDVSHDGTLFELILADHAVIYRAFPLYPVVK